MRRRKFRNGKFLLQSSVSQRTSVLAVLITVSLVCTIYVQGPMLNFKSTGLKLLLSGTRSLLSLDNSSLAIESQQDPLQSLFIIVPYRNRSENKNVFITEMKQYLKRKVSDLINRNVQPRKLLFCYWIFFSSAFLRDFSLWLDRLSGDGASDTWRSPAV